jgi:hypothetical protein
MEELKKIGPLMLSVSIVIIGMMVFFSIIEFKLTPVTDTRIQKIVDIEAFENPPTSFCKSHEGKRHELETSCGKLSKDNCLATSCCVYADMKGKESCHSGDEHGPTFRRDKNGKTNDIEYYYFKNKCYGNNCPKE